MIRKARAVWYGGGRGGKGSPSSESGVLADRNCPGTRVLRTEITLDEKPVC